LVNGEVGEQRLHRRKSKERKKRGHRIVGKKSGDGLQTKAPKGARGEEGFIWDGFFVEGRAHRPYDKTKREGKKKSCGGGEEV